MRCRIAAVFAISAALSSSAPAQAVRAWVSTSGLDTNPCSRTAPCRQFSAGINAVAANGEVVALDTGGYGPIVVDKPVSIVAPEGVHAAIAPTTGDAVNITPAANGAVLLQNLFLNGQGGSNGVVHNGAGQLSVVECTISRFQVNGITAYAVTPGDPIQLAVARSNIRDCSSGILVSGGTSFAEVDGCLLERNTTYGIGAGFSTVHIRNTVASHCNVGYQSEGIVEISDSAAYSCDYGFFASAISFRGQISMDRCISSGNGTGIHALIFMILQPLIRVSNSMITNNATGVGGNGPIYSRGDNTLENNATGNSFGVFTYPAK